jgi:hypothetical protein
MSQKKRRNERHVSFVPPLSTTASVNGYSRRQHSSIQVEEKVGTATWCNATSNYADALIGIRVAMHTLQRCYSTCNEINNIKGKP